LEDLGHSVQTASDVHSGLQLFAEHLTSDEPFDLVLTDMRMPLSEGQPEDEMGGLTAIREILTRENNTIVLVMTAYGTIRNAVQAIQLGAFDYLEKPFEVEELRLRIDKAIAHRRLQRENQSLQQENRRLFERVAAPYHASGIIGGSLATRTLMAALQRAAQTDATVLIQGASGTGKELVANAIHHHSPRARKPMIPLNCAAFPEHLIESELFGHLRGAFTGANTTRIGAFEEADGGTIFLDEIGEMPLAMQPRLLRVLEGKVIKRIGENRERPVDVRVVAATNRDLRQQIQAGNFREDLYERLNVIPILIPPLREHKEDIPALVNHFLRLSDRAGRIEGISPAALDALMAYDWPRNVRELRNVIERTVLFMTESVIEPHHLSLPSLPQPTPLYPPYRGEGQQVGESRSEATQPPPTFSIVLPDGCTTLEQVEQEIIRQAYAYTGGNVSRAAKLIGIARETFRRKLAQAVDGN
jgi:DNA-binding NtrC family response regulator